MGPLDNLFFSVTGNQVLWAKSEKFGSAVIQHSGMMEYWSVGIMGLAEGIYFYGDGTEQNLKPDRHPFLIPNIPLFHSESKANSTPLG